MNTRADKRVCSLLEGDAGLTLAELLVAVTLLVVVLSAAWLFNGALRKGQQVSDREAMLSRALGTPEMRLQEILLQNSAIDLTQPRDGYTLSVRTDQNLDDVLEQHTFAATTSGTITELAYTLDANGGRVGSPFINATIGVNNRNRADGQPLFTYLDQDGAVITNPDLIAGDARAIVLKIRATVDGRSVQESATVEFRNRF